MKIQEIYPNSYYKSYLKNDITYSVGDFALMRSTFTSSAYTVKIEEIWKSQLDQIVMLKLRLYEVKENGEVIDKKVQKFKTLQNFFFLITNKKKYTENRRFIPILHPC